jgi:hypothetical protein
VLNLHTAPADIPEGFGARDWSRSAKTGRLLGRLIRILRKLPTGEQPFRQKPSGLKSNFHGDRRILCFKRGLAYQCLFSNILPSWDQHCSSFYLLRMLTSATTRVIRALTDRYLKARFTHLGLRKV